MSCLSVSYIYIGHWQYNLAGIFWGHCTNISRLTHDRHDVKVGFQIWANARFRAFLCIFIGRFFFCHKNRQKNTKKDVYINKQTKKRSKEPKLCLSSSSYLIVDFFFSHNINSWHLISDWIAPDDGTFYTICGFFKYCTMAISVHHRWFYCAVLKFKFP